MDTTAVFLAELNGSLAANGRRSGTKLERGENDHNLFESWATAMRNGFILIVGKETEMGFIPIKTFVPQDYVEYTCSGGCRDGHELHRERLRNEACPRCGDERRRYEVKDGKPVGLTEVKAAA